MIRRSGGFHFGGPKSLFGRRQWSMISCSFLCLAAFISIGEVRDLKSVDHKPPNGPHEKPPASEPVPVWTAYDLDMDILCSGGESAASPADLATFVLPGTNEWGISTFTSEYWSASGAFIGKSMVAAFYISLTNGPSAFISGYENAVWNTCSAPPNVRLFFTSVPGPYNYRVANEYPTHYWWSVADRGYFDLSFGAEVTLIGDMNDPSQWTDADGVSGSAVPEAFFSAAANLTVVGLSFGGQCFYDTGDQVSGVPGKPDSPAGTLHLQAFQPN
jgi:hypothetical protein